MARIPFGKKRSEELKKINKNALNKKSRIRTSKGLEVKDVETKSASDFSSVKEYNQYISDMKHFTKRQNRSFTMENKHGVEYTQGEIVDTEKEIRRINRKKRTAYDKIKDKEFTDRGQPLGTIGQQRQMNDIRYSDFNPVKLDFNSYQSKKDFKKRKDSIEHMYRDDFITRRAKTYKSNYLKSLHTVFGEFAELNSRVADLQQHIENMSTDEFMDFYYSKNFSNLGFVYEKQEADVKLQEIENAYYD